MTTYRLMVRDTHPAAQYVQGSTIRPWTRDSTYTNRALAEHRANQLNQVRPDDRMNIYVEVAP